MHVHEATIECVTSQEMSSNAMMNTGCIGPCYPGDCNPCTPGLCNPDHTCDPSQCTPDFECLP